jgi:hypothetical protein
MLDVGFNFLKLFLVVPEVWLHFVCHLGARIHLQFGASCFLPYGATAPQFLYDLFTPIGQLFCCRRENYLRLRNM